MSPPSLRNSKRRKSKMDNGLGSFFKKGFSIATIFYCLFTPYAAQAEPKLVPAHLEGQEAQDIPLPYNLQASVLGRTATLSWAWDAPDPSPQFQSFGYEVFRDSAVVAIVPSTAYTDFNLPVGPHSYKVRAKGGAKEMGKKVAHISDWSEPAEIKVTQTCGGPPVIQLTVEPTKKIYGSIPSLRLHFTGDVTVPTGCEPMDHVVYHIDSGLSTERTGKIMADSKGHFDEFIDAMGAEDETITGAATFNITVTAKNEVGGTTSGVFTINLDREDPYAPKQPR